ncbi:hypothetical protein LT493_02890 [Streptomyces tricolor]|nr:hypothetical protein [Streptomyces tricolor]
MVTAPALALLAGDRPHPAPAASRGAGRVSGGRRPAGGGCPWPSRAGSSAGARTRGGPGAAAGARRRARHARDRTGRLLGPARGTTRPTSGRGCRCGCWPPGEDGFGRTDVYAGLPDVREPPPARARAAQPLSGDRYGDRPAPRHRARGGHRPHAPRPGRRTGTAAARPARSAGAPAGAAVPAGTARLTLTARLHSSTGPGTTPR